ncbi:ester cyclase [Ruegeria atlantica]|uniref:Putative ester cyclase n=1 Tax=Ruegeria atlantica TaxID=81569 RepID=A0A0P1EUP6_9RHOB|nr:ester cyclase [Ruegeria atlantica]CUH47170.1 putative ester cyclase [Ruegeria atlantica]
MTYSNKWKDFPDYIIGITKEIWEDRGTETLNRYYASNIPVRTPMGISQGNQGVIASTMATCHEFPDRQLFAEDVIWSNSEEDGHLSSHRLLTTATHLQDGQFGKASGKKWVVRVIADCAAKGETIYDEWLVRDYGGLVRQLGMEPEEYTRELIMAEGGPDKATRPFTPDIDVDGGYHGTGNENEWGARYAETLARIMDKDFNHILADYDRAVIGDYAGSQQAIGRDAVSRFWIGLRSSFPNATFAIHHQIGMDGGMMPPRAAIRWSLDGTHDGWGAFGRPTGAKVHVMGMSHAEFGPWGLRREYSYYDEVAIWKQILLQTGDV